MIYYEIILLKLPSCLNVHVLIWNLEEKYVDFCPFIDPLVKIKRNQVLTENVQLSLDHLYQNNPFIITVVGDSGATLKHGIPVTSKLSKGQKLTS